jgi:hypothetical protein
MLDLHSSHIISYQLLINYIYRSLMKLLISNQAIYMSSMNIIQIPIFVMQSYDLYMMLKCRWLLLVATHFGHSFQILLIFIFNATLSYKLCLYIDGYHFLQANFKFLLYVKDLVSYIVNFIICETRSFKGGNFNFFLMNFSF